MNCRLCKNPASFACASCKTHFYCNQKCQIVDWHINHQFSCDARILQRPATPTELSKYRERTYPNMHVKIDVGSTTKRVNVYFLPKSGKVTKNRSMYKNRFLTAEIAAPLFDELQQHQKTWDFYIPPDFFTKDLKYAMFYIILTPDDYDILNILISGGAYRNPIEQRTNLGYMVEEFVRNEISKETPSKPNFKALFLQEYTLHTAEEWILYFKRLYKKYMYSAESLSNQAIVDTCPEPYASTELIDQHHNSITVDELMTSYSLDNCIMIIETLKKLGWGFGRILPEKMWNLIGEKVLPGEVSKIQIRHNGEIMDLFHSKQTTDWSYHMQPPSELLKKVQPTFVTKAFDFDKLYADFHIGISAGGEETDDDIGDYLNGKSSYLKWVSKEDPFFDPTTFGLARSTKDHMEELPHHKPVAKESFIQHLTSIINPVKAVITVPGRKRLEIIDVLIHEAAHVILEHPFNELEKPPEHGSMPFDEIRNWYDERDAILDKRKREFEYQAILTTLICFEILGYILCQQGEYATIMSVILRQNVQYARSCGIHIGYLNEKDPEMQKLTQKCIKVADMIIRSGLHLDPPTESSWK